MSDLKTLKDLNLFNCWNEELDIDEKGIYVEELKAEAVKWVKQLREVHTTIAQGALIWKFMLFFNLTESDLEEKE